MKTFAILITLLLLTGCNQTNAPVPSKVGVIKALPFDPVVSFQSFVKKDLETLNAYKNFNVMQYKTLDVSKTDSLTSPYKAVVFVDSLIEYKTELWDADVLYHIEIAYAYENSNWIPIGYKSTFKVADVTRDTTEHAMMQGILDKDKEQVKLFGTLKQMAHVLSLTKE